MGSIGRFVIILSAIVSTVLLLSISVSADIAIPGMTNKGITYVITNMKDYPDSVFLTTSAIWGGEYAKLVNPDGSFGGGGYKLDGYILKSIPVKVIPASILSELKEGGDEKVSQVVQDYLKNAKGAVTANTPLEKTKLVSDTLPLEKITVFLHIENASQKELNYNRDKVTYSYMGGGTETFVLSGNGELPDPSGKNTILPTVQPTTKTTVSQTTKSGNPQNMGLIKITTVPLGVKVYLDNVFKGKSPVTLYLSFGNHQFVLNNGTFPMFVQNFEIKNTTPQIFNINLRNQDTGQALFPIPVNNSTTGSVKKR